MSVRAKSRTTKPPSTAPCSSASDRSAAQLMSRAETAKFERDEGQADRGADGAVDAAQKIRRRGSRPARRSSAWRAMWSAIRLSCATGIPDAATTVADSMVCRPLLSAIAAWYRKYRATTAPDEREEAERQEEERAGSERLVEEVAEESEEHRAGDQAQRLAESVVESAFGLCPLASEFQPRLSPTGPPIATPRGSARTACECIRKLPGDSVDGQTEGTEVRRFWRTQRVTRRPGGGSRGPPRRPAARGSGPASSPGSAGAAPARARTPPGRRGGPGRTARRAAARAP